MSGQYLIKYSSMDQFFSEIATRINEWNTQLETWRSNYNELINMETFAGKSAEAVKAYFGEVHEFLLQSIIVANARFQSEFLLYKNQYYNIDSNVYAVLSQERLLDIKKRFEQEITYLNNISNDINSSLNSVSDIFQSGKPNKDSLEASLLTSKDKITTLNTNIEEYERSQSGIARGELRSLLESLKQAVSAYAGENNSISGYRSGDLCGQAEVLVLYQNVLSGTEYLQENQKLITEAAEHQEAVYEQMQADYEAACEAREDEGRVKVITGVAAVVVGGVAIVCTAGAATPIVVTAAVAGTCSVAYGTSNMIEGGQDIYYGMNGDLASYAINPIRDTVFCGNQGAYDVWGNLSMTVAGLCVPVSHAVNGAAGMGNTAIAKAAAMTIAKEVVVDQTLDFVSGKITNYATDKWDLNQTEATLLNFGINFGLDKTADAIDTKISGEPSFAEKMSYDDATKYNQYWSDLESGKHSGYPGMTDADVKAWEFADSRLNEHIAINKVNANDIIEIRKTTIDRNTKIDIEIKSEKTDNIIVDGSHLENGKLKSNITYKAGEHDYIYRTNEDGLITNASTDNLQLKNHEGRLKHDTNTYGKEAGDHAGHLFGDRFGGSPELDNLVSQAKDVNLSEFKIIENQWADALENGQKVTVDIAVNYDAGSTRPTSFDVSYTIDDIPFFQTINN